jgi:hypothetical protein
MEYNWFSMLGWGLFAACLYCILVYEKQCKKIKAEREEREALAKLAKPPASSPIAASDTVAQDTPPTEPPAAK